MEQSCLPPEVMLARKLAEMKFAKLYMITAFSLLFLGCEEQKETTSKSSLQNPYKEVMHWQYKEAAKKFDALQNPAQLERYNFAVVSLAYSETELGEKQRHQDKQVSSRGVVGTLNALKNKADKAIEADKIVGKYKESKEFAKKEGLNLLLNLTKEGHEKSFIEMANYFTFKDNDTLSYFWLKASQIALIKGGGFYFNKEHELTSHKNAFLLRFKNSLESEINFIEESMAPQQIANRKQEILNTVASGLICETEDVEFEVFGLLKLGRAFSYVDFFMENNELDFKVSNRMSKWVEEIDYYRNGNKTINRKTLEYRYEPTEEELSEHKIKINRLFADKSMRKQFEPPKPIFASCNYLASHSEFISALVAIKDLGQGKIKEKLQSNKF